MPVFARVREGVLVVTVDGDYTANELRRVASGGFEGDDTPARVPVLLDLSGAAGISNMSPTDLAATGAIFGTYRDRLNGIAVVAPPELFSFFDGQSDFASEAGVRVHACTSHAVAREWLLQAS